MPGKGINEIILTIVERAIFIKKILYKALIYYIGDFNKG